MKGSVLRLLAIWAGVIVIGFGLMELAARAVLFNCGDFGSAPVEYEPFVSNTPDALIPVGEKRPRVTSSFLDRYERIRRLRAIVPGAVKPVADLDPNVDYFYLQSIDHPYRVVTNSVGLRRKTEISTIKPSGVYRIYCLGDSFTFGPYLNNHETYPNLLEEMLNNNDAGAKYEALNAGVSGYTLRQELGLFVERGYRSHPDLVILQVLDNDVPDYEELKYPRPSDPDTVWPNTYSYKMRLFVREWAANIALLRLARGIRLAIGGQLSRQAETLSREINSGKSRKKYIGDPKQGRSKASGMWFDKSRKRTLEKLKRYYATDLEKLARFTRERKIGLVIVLFPTQRTIRFNETDGRNPVSDFFAAAAHANGLEFVDLTPSFGKGDRTRFYFLWPWNGHMSFMGNLLAAETIAPVVENMIKRRR